MKALKIIPNILFLLGATACFVSMIIAPWADPECYPLLSILLNGIVIMVAGLVVHLFAEEAKK